MTAVGATQLPMHEDQHSARPASPGAMTWDGAPAVCHRLGTLRRGDQVTVTREDGKTAVFTVIATIWCWRNRT
jgi:hypothetical protein